MIDTNELNGIIAKKGLTKRQVALGIGMNAETFYRKYRKKVFNSDEIKRMISFLEITDPVAIFFADDVVCQDTQQRADIPSRSFFTQKVACEDTRSKYEQSRDKKTDTGTE